MRINSTGMGEIGKLKSTLLAKETVVERDDGQWARLGPSIGQSSLVHVLEHHASLVVVNMPRVISTPFPHGLSESDEKS